MPSIHCGESIKVPLFKGIFGFNLHSVVPFCNHKFPDMFSVFAQNEILYLMQMVDMLHTELKQYYAFIVLNSIYIPTHNTSYSFLYYIYCEYSKLHIRYLLFYYRYLYIYIYFNWNMKCKILILYIEYVLLNTIYHLLHMINCILYIKLCILNMKDYIS